MDSKTIKALIRLIAKMITILLVGLLIYLFVGGFHVVHDNNMFPAIRDGDLLITYKLDTPYAQDVITYEVDGRIMVGRVIGTPGDVVNITDDGFYSINGSVPYETIYYETTKLNSSVITYPYTVKDGELFVLSDLREEGKDSRIYGAITNFKGKVVLVLRRRGF